jgi:hypothetical protein
VADEVLDAPWSPLTEDEGWRLPKELIPSLALHDSDTCPAFPPTFETNWTSYYQWRGLPMASPAAILLHWPLAVYACLKELGLLQSATDLRKKLTVFYVGARVHIAIPCHLFFFTYQPLFRMKFALYRCRYNFETSSRRTLMPPFSFGELALLIPNTDLDLVMFGEVGVRHV